MSMYLASSAENASGDAYVVVAPRASDMLRNALRDAYRAPGADGTPFDDLLGKLNRIDLTPCRT